MWIEVFAAYFGVRNLSSFGKKPMLNLCVEMFSFVFFPEEKRFF